MAVPGGTTLDRSCLDSPSPLHLYYAASPGEIGGKYSVHSPSARTDASAAVSFVNATGIDELAVAIGNSDGMLRSDSELDLDLLGELRRQVSVPLVLHGSSGERHGSRSSGTRRDRKGQCWYPAQRDTYGGVPDDRECAQLRRPSVLSGSRAGRNV